MLFIGVDRLLEGRLEVLIGCLYRFSLTFRGGGRLVRLRDVHSPVDVGDDIRIPVPTAVDVTHLIVLIGC